MLRKNNFYLLRRPFTFAQSTSNQFKMGKNYHRLSLAIYTKKMHIFGNITGILEIYLHCHTCDHLSYLASKQCSDKNQRCLGCIYEKERDLELN